MAECNPCEQAANLPAAGEPCAPSCADMLCEAVMAYNAVRRSMMSGKTTAEVKFGEQAVKYAATSETVKFLLDDIRRLNMSCPSDASKAILGLGATSGPMGVGFGCGPRPRCGC
jgi:hypothetical protein